MNENTHNSDTNIKNLIYLSSQVDINLFNKKQLKPKKRIIKECEQVKKKELKNLSTILKNLSKLGSDNNMVNIKNIYKNFENKVDNIDKIISCANNLDTKDIIIEDSNLSKKKNNIGIQNNYLECFGNC
jgi:hypothetical protein